MIVRFLPPHRESYSADLADMEPVKIARTLQEGTGVHLGTTEDRKVLRRRVEDALRKTATDGQLVRFALELGARLD